MKTILLMHGPVCTHRAIHQNGPKFIRHIVKSQFLSACGKLVSENVGQLEKVRIGNWLYNVFVKKSPSEIGNGFFERNPDFGTLEQYMAVYFSHPPACTGEKLMEKLILGGFLRNYLL